MIEALSFKQVVTEGMDKREELMKHGRKMEFPELMTSGP